MTTTTPATSTEGLPATPADPGMTWATDVSTGKLHLRSHGKTFCNPRFRTVAVDALPAEVPAGVCRSCRKSARVNFTALRGE